MRGLIGKQTIRPPAIDVPMSASAQRFTLHAPIEAVESAIAGLQQAGWRLVETASINRGLVAQSRYSFIDATERKDAGAEYVLECRCYEGDWAVLAIDWFPFRDSARVPRRPNEMEADIRSGLERVRMVAELVDQA